MIDPYLKKDHYDQMWVPQYRSKGSSDPWRRWATPSRYYHTGASAKAALTTSQKWHTSLAGPYDFRVIPVRIVPDEDFPSLEK